MANHKQAEKRNRQRLKRRARNLIHLGIMRTYLKRIRKAIDANDMDTAKENLPAAIQAIGKACSKGAVHSKAASRYISRITKAVSKAIAA